MFPDLHPLHTSTDCRATGINAHCCQVACAVERHNPHRRDTIIANDIEAKKADAELIRLCAAHQKLARLANEEAVESGPHWKAYCQSERSISNARPQTIYGVLAKVRAAQEAATGDNPRLADDWIAESMKDLLRLNPSVMR